jgi:RsiW-degrading membrane proteinase PrsW (M82 family)
VSASAGWAQGRPRWGVQASLARSSGPARSLFALLVGFGLLGFVGQEEVLVQWPAAFGLSWLLVILYAIPVALIIYRLDLFEREPKAMLAAALVWGGLVATSLASIANEAWLSVLGKVAPLDLTADWGPAIVAPGVEEPLKLMGVVLLFLIVPTEFDGVMDGFVYGAMVGLGFTVVEDVSYFMHAVVLVGGGDQAGPVWNVFLIRVVAGGLYGHVLFTGLTGMGFAYLVTKPRVALSRRLAVAGLCLAAGVAAHAVWNSPLIESVLATEGSARTSELQWIVYGGLKGMPFLLLLMLLVAFATRSEERAFRAIVAGEPSPDVITEADIGSLRSLWARRVARAAAAREHGPAAGKLTGSLQKAQIEYAMIRSRVDSIDDRAVEAQRQRIRLIRHQLVEAGVAQPVAAVAQAADAPRPATEATSGVEAAAAPAAELPLAAVPGWTPTHIVPVPGMAAWFVPDPSQRPIGLLPAGLELEVEMRAGAWAQVRAANGWRGWVDGRVLIERR